MRGAGRAVCVRNPDVGSPQQHPRDAGTHERLREGTKKGSSRDLGLLSPGKLLQDCVLFPVAEMRGTAAAGLEIRHR